ncbi:helix-turn-helix domain-containing protein [Afifella aestuarii]|uniref:helix-turn-helix domain-containing protein n=1 Tax=Afifella aestuarii TaxID=1909496 RepID=UPI0013E38D5A|nr:helix-turn-helix domain-containing protein [Afifella aestuarii]
MTGPKTSGPRLAILPRGVARDRRLTPSAKDALLLIAEAASTKTGWCSRKQKTMADELSVSRKTLQAALYLLEQTGWIEIRSGKGAGQACRYRIRREAPGIPVEFSAQQYDLFASGAVLTERRDAVPAHGDAVPLADAVPPQVWSDAALPDRRRHGPEMDAVSAGPSRLKGVPSPESEALASPSQSSGDRGVPPPGRQGCHPQGGRGCHPQGGTIRVRTRRAPPTTEISLSGDSAAALRVPEKTNWPEKASGAENTRGDIPVSPGELLARLREAAGPALMAGPHLADPAEPLRWLAAGCSLEADILPAIRAVALRRPPGSVRTWSYFAAAVTEARERRTVQVPAADGHGNIRFFRRKEDGDEGISADRAPRRNRGESRAEAIAAAVALAACRRSHGGG